MQRLEKEKPTKKGDEAEIESTSISFESLLMKLADNDKETIKSAKDWFCHSKFDDNELSKLLTFAVERGLLKIVELFVTDKRKAVRRQLNNFDFTNYLNNPYIDNLNIVMLSIKQRRLTLFKWLVKKKKYDLSKDGINPILLAMRYGQFSILKIVIKKTYNPSRFKSTETNTMMDANGNPPLVLVAKYGYLQMFKWIFKKYDSTYRRDDYLYRHMYCPTWYKGGRGNAQAQFYNRKTGDNPVHVAVKYKRIEILKFLVPNKAELIDTPNLVNGNCAVHFAARNNYLPGLLHLLRSGCDFLIANKKGDYPIHLAAKKGNVKAVQMLLQHGCPVDIKSEIGDTIYDLASEGTSEGHRAIVNLVRGIRNLPPLDGPPKEDAFHETFDELLGEMQSQENFHEAMSACLHVIGDKSKSPDLQGRARLMLANMLLRGDCILPENDDNPLEKIAHSVLQADENRIVRSIQAFYLLRNDESVEAGEIKFLLHKHLSGIDFSEPSPEIVTNDNWLPGIFDCYTAYFLFKEYGSADTHTTMLIKHLVDSATKALGNSKTSSPVSNRARFGMFETASPVSVADSVVYEDRCEKRR